MITEEEKKAAVAELVALSATKITAKEGERRRAYQRNYWRLQREELAARKNRPEVKARQKEIHRRSRQKHKEAANARNRRWRKENTERARATDAMRRNRPEVRERNLLRRREWYRKKTGKTPDQLRPWVRFHAEVDKLPEKGVWLTMTQLHYALGAPITRLKYQCKALNVRAVIYKRALYAEIAEMKEALSWRSASLVHKYYTRRPWLKRPAYPPRKPPLLILEQDAHSLKVWAPELIGVNITARVK